jgi:hypothetical protein
MSDRVICQKMTLTDNSFNMSMQKLINIKWCYWSLLSIYFAIMVMV